MKNILLTLMTLVIAILLLVAAYAFLEDHTTARQLEAEARLTARRAAAAQARADLERATGERAILEAAAQATQADRVAAHSTSAEIPALWVGVFLITVTLLLGGMMILVLLARAGRALPQLENPALATDWRAQALYWQRLALLLAAILRERTTVLSVVERRALQATERTLGQE